MLFLYLYILYIHIFAFVIKISKSWCKKFTYITALCYAKYISLSGENMANHIKSFFTSIIPHFEPWKTNLLQNWNTIVGDLHEHVKLINIQNNMLVLGVHDSAWLQEIYILSPVLIKTINNYLGNEYITNVRFKNIGYNSTKIVHKKKHEKK